jgi:glucokinase
VRAQNFREIFAATGNMPPKYIIGIDLGGTNLKIALLDLSCRIKKKHIFNTSSFVQKESLIRAISDSVLKIISGSGLNKSQLAGIGMGLPGPIDADRGIVHFFPNIPGWMEVGLKKILEKGLSIPVFIDNDANLMALAEYELGAARGCKNAVCLTLGTGVGGGLILEGKLFRGSSFAAGEIGHMPINEKGPGCNCGGVACLESYIGNRRIMQLAKKIFKRQISLEELSSLADHNNKKAVRIWKKVGSRLGVALVGVVNLLNPDCIVIGGGVANAGRILFDSVEETILSRAMIVQAKAVKVVKAKLGNDAGMIGASLLVKSKI